MFEEIIREIGKHNRIIIHRHSKPDGDAIGSQAGLKYLIEENFPGKEVYAVGDAAGRYAFMDGSTPDVIPDGYYADALAIVLDTSSPALISDARWQTAAATARIDHHIFLEKIAATEVVDSTYESCCGLVAEMARESGWRLTPAAARSLYTGMVTDSGRFRYDATNARTFRLASYLMEQPIDTNALYRNLYASDYAQLVVRAKFLLHVQFTEKNVAYVYTTMDGKAEYGVDDFTLSRGMVNSMADMRGVDIWVNFTESDKGVLCELRSSRFNINPIAVKYGGGGHAMASGATLPDHKTAMAMLADLDAMMKEDDRK